MYEHDSDAPRVSAPLRLVAELQRRTLARGRAVGGGPLDQLCAELGPSHVVIVAGDEVWSCEARRFAEGRAS